MSKRNSREAKAERRHQREIRHIRADVMRSPNPEHYLTTKLGATLIVNLCARPFTFTDLYRCAGSGRLAADGDILSNGIDTGRAPCTGCPDCRDWRQR